MNSSAMQTQSRAGRSRAEERGETHAGHAPTSACSRALELELGVPTSALGHTTLATSHEGCTELGLPLPSLSARESWESCTDLRRPFRSPLYCECVRAVLGLAEWLWLSSDERVKSRSDPELDWREGEAWPVCWPSSDEAVQLLFSDSAGSSAAPCLMCSHNLKAGASSRNVVRIMM